MKYAVIFEWAETNWAAYVPDLPGGMTTGRTLEETKRNVRQFGDPVPEPSTHPRQ